MLRRVAFLPLLVVSLAACDLLGGGSPDPTRPAVSSVSPEDNAQAVPVNTTVSATLTLPNSDIDEGTVGNRTVTLTPEGSDSPVAATRNVSGNTLTLTPDEPLDFSTRYTFSVLSTVQDEDGASFVTYSSTFTTVSEGGGGGTTDPPPAGATLTSSTERLIFETREGQTSEPQTLTLSNTGDEAFTLSSLAPASDQFVLTSDLSLPTEVAPGGSVEVAVAFKPTDLGPQGTTLEINGGAEPAVALRGLSVEGDGGDLEPSLQWIFDTFDLAISTGDEDPTTTTITSDATNERLNSTLGDEITAPTFQKAGSGEVTVEVLAAYGVDNSPVARFGWYEASGAQRNDLFDVTSGADNAQTLNPNTSGPLSFDPGNQSFGFYSFWPTNDVFDERYIYTQDELNTFAVKEDRPGPIPHHVRAYELPGERNAYVLATEEFTLGYDYNDVVVIVRNVEPLGEVSTGASCNQASPILSSRSNLPTARFGSLELQNLTGAPFGDRLVFSRIGDISQEVFGEKPETFPFIDLQCHTLNVVRLNNTSSSTLQVSGLTITGEASDAFRLRGNGSSFSIGAGGSVELTVEFTENTGGRGIREATLQMQVDGQTVEVELAGIYQRAPEGSREEFLGGVVKAFGYSTDMGTNPRGEIESAEPPGDPNFAGAAGDEVISQFWRPANGSEPVYIRQLAAFHSCCSSGSADDLRVVENGNIIGQFKHAPVYGQSVLPPLQGSSTQAAEMTVTPSGPFELVVRGGYSTDWIGGSKNSGNLGVRLWPAKRNGATIENTYIVSQDFVDQGCGTTDRANCDFNDNMYLITNVAPVEPR